MITKKNFSAFKSGESHSAQFLNQWQRYFKEKPIDVGFIFYFDKFGPLYKKIQSSQSLKSTTKALSWFLDNYQEILEATEAKLVSMLEQESGV